MIARVARPVGTTAAWAPIVLVAIGAAIPGLRWPIVVAVSVGAAATCLRSGRMSPQAGTWLGAVAVGAVLAWGIVFAPSIALPDTSRCADALAPTAVARAVEAVVILLLVAALLVVHGDRAALRLGPPSRRITLLASVAPLVVVPAALWVGPALAAPFFGTLALEVTDARALVPAALFAVSNASLEEVAYRGALLGWASRSIGARGAVAAQAIMFGFAHMGSDVMPVTAPLLWAGMTLSGLVAGVAVIRTRSLWLALAVHAAFDVPLYYALACRAAGP